MQIITLDFETFFSADYTLKKMTTEAYIRDPRFATLCCGVREHDNLRACYDAAEFAAWAKSQDWSAIGVVAHHAHFDGLILAHHYGVKPAFWFDTLSMARMVHGADGGNSLGALAARYKLDEKSVPYDLFRGKTWAELGVQGQMSLSDGCLHDVELTWEIFKRLGDGYPLEEYKVVDQTVRFFTEPALEGDIPLLEDLRQAEWDNKNGRMIALGVGAAQLQSSAQFVALLEAEGVEVEYKAGKNEPIPAIAATDNFMRDLEGHDNPRVADLAAARLEVKSTIDETRSARLAAMASRGSLPIYLAYCGAKTLRWSGGDKVNFQNFRRGGELRRSLMAPKGHMVGVIDLAQIECRVLNVLAGQDDVVEKFRQRRDLYSEIASKFYGEEVTKAQADKRGLGKQMILSCGYGSGAATFQRTAERGTYGPSIKLELEECVAAVKIYRDEHAKVVRYWKTCDAVLRALEAGAADFEWGPLRVKGDKIILPNGSWMNYNLAWDQERQSYVRKTRRGSSKIWGGVLTQNICEAVSRLILSQAMLRIAAAGIRVVGCTHDELVMVMPEAQIEAAMAFASAEMVRDVPWLPGIPLDCEGSFGERYSK